MVRKSLSLLTVAFVLGSFVPGAQAQQGTSPAEEAWLPSLITRTPEQGFALAITLARKAVTETQPDRSVLRAERPEYASDADSLIAASHVVAVHFQTIAAANDYWRGEGQGQRSSSSR